MGLIVWLGVWLSKEGLSCNYFTLVISHRKVLAANRMILRVERKVGERILGRLGGGV